MPWRLLAFPIATGMLAHAARWALITVAGGSVATGALVARMLVSVIVTLLMKSLDVAVLASTLAVAGCGGKSASSSSKSSPTTTTHKHKSKPAY